MPKRNNITGLIRHYHHLAPIMDMDIQSMTFEKTFPVTLEVASEKLAAIKDICEEVINSNTVNFSEAELRYALQWISTWMGTEENVEQLDPKKKKMVKIPFKGKEHDVPLLPYSAFLKKMTEYNNIRAQLRALFLDKNLSPDQLLKKHLIKETLKLNRIIPVSREEQLIKLSDLKRNVLDDASLHQEYKANPNPSPGRRSRLLNRLKGKWLLLMIKLLEENSTLPREQVLIICAKVFWINGHKFINRKKEIVNPYGGLFTTEQIARPLYSLAKRVPTFSIRRYAFHKSKRFE